MKTFLTLLCAVGFASTMQRSLQFADYTCNSAKVPAILSLKNHFELTIDSAFSISFWFQYKESSGKAVFSLHSGAAMLPVTLSPNRRLNVGDMATNLSELSGVSALSDPYRSGTDIGMWHFLTFSAKVTQTGNKATLEFKIIQNLEIGESMTIDTSIDPKNTQVVFGSITNTRACEINSQYHSVYFMDHFFSGKGIDLNAFIGGYLTPVFLSSFNREGAYTKWYSNLLRSGVGDMMNGLNPDSFAIYSNLATSANPIGKQMNLANDLGTFLLPQGLLPSTPLDGSYTFVMHYEFFYKDYAQLTNENGYYHVLYQRIPKGGELKLIRADLKLGFSPELAAMSQRYFVNNEVVKHEPFVMPLEKNGRMREIKIGYIMIQVVSHPLQNKARVSFMNGFSNTPAVFNSSMPLFPTDAHMIGDFDSLDSTRKDILSFVRISEIAFYRGSNSALNSSPVGSTSDTPLITDGFSKKPIILVCNNRQAPQRLANESGAITFESCIPATQSSKLKSLQRSFKLRAMHLYHLPCLQARFSTGKQQLCKVRPAGGVRPNSQGMLSRHGSKFSRGHPVHKPEIVFNQNRCREGPLFRNSQT